MKKRWLILAFLLSAFAALLWTAPAAQLYHWFVPDDLPASPGSLHGSVSKGTTDVLLWQDRIVARNLQWRLRPMELLMLRAGWNIRFAGPATGQIRASVSPGGRLSLRSGRLVASLDAVLTTAGYASMPVRGQVGVDITDLRLDHATGRPGRASAEVTLRGLAWAVGDNPLPIGHFRATVHTDRDGVLRADISADDDSPVEAEGEAWLDPEGVYETHIRIRARPDAPEQTANLLRLIGQPDDQGVYHLRQRGTL